MDNLAVGLREMILAVDDARRPATGSFLQMAVATISVAGVIGIFWEQKIEEGRKGSSMTNESDPENRNILPFLPKRADPVPNRLPGLRIMGKG